MTVIFQKYFSKVWTDQISGKKIGMKKKKTTKTCNPQQNGGGRREIVCD